MPSSSKNDAYHLSEVEYLRAIADAKIDLVDEIWVHNLQERLIASEEDLRAIKSSKTWKLITKLKNAKLYLIIARILKKIFRAIVHIWRVRVYLYPPNWIWLIRNRASMTLRSEVQKIFFKEIRNPNVSIIIPIHGKVALTVRCLSSLMKLHTDLDIEVIVVDDCSPDSSVRILSKIQGLILHKNKTNIGFVLSCNAGANVAKGKYLVFLNNDTEVDRRWLDPLINKLKEDQVGIVGSKLVYPDGTLQEAGGIIFSNGSGWNYGKGDNPKSFEYEYSKEVDYCSGASIAIQKNIFEKVGGFDERYAPAYYEDTDLAFKVRAAGYKVIYEPTSLVVHHEGASAGTNLNQGMKRFQVINQKKFVDKWGLVLKNDQYSSPKNLVKARDRASKKMALIIDEIVPAIDKDSGSVRMNALIGVIQSLGYKVTFWPRYLVGTQPYTQNLQQTGVEVVYGDINFQEFSKKRGVNYDLVILSRPNIAPTFLNTVLAYYPNAKTIYDTVDLAFLRKSRQYDLDHSKTTLKESKILKKVELGTIQRVDASIVVSPIEKQLIARLSPKSLVGVVSNIHEQKNLPNNDFLKRKDLLFIGNFFHEPNIDAMVWFCEEVMPLINKQDPKIKLNIVGSNSTEQINKLASRNVNVLGFVENVDSIFNQSRVFIAPLRFGAGVKGKVGQALEYGIPVVSTSVGIEGMYMKNGQNCLIADTEEKFANAVIKLYNDKEYWEAICEKSKGILEKHFSTKSAKRNLEKLIESI